MNGTDRYKPRSIPRSVLNARRAWVALLREGRYEKQQGALGNAEDTARCCLGVACHPSVVGGIQRGITDGNAVFFNEENLFLPLAAKSALGFREDPHVEIDGTLFSVASLNDARSLGDDDLESAVLDRDWSHAEIANLIERDFITPHEVTND